MTDPITRIEAVLAEATPGPWHVIHCRTPDMENLRDVVGPDEARRGYPACSAPNDARLIALARNVLPDLLAVARAAERMHTSLDLFAPGWRDDPACAALRVALDTFRSHVTELLPEEPSHE